MHRALTPLANSVCCITGGLELLGDGSKAEWHTRARNREGFVVQIYVQGEPASHKRSTTRGAELICIKPVQLYTRRHQMVNVWGDYLRRWARRGDGAVVAHIPPCRQQQEQP